MIERVENVNGGLMIEGTITVNDDMPAGVIYAEIFKEVQEMLMKNVFDGSENIEYPATETERH